MVTLTIGRVAYALSSHPTSARAQPLAVRSIGLRPRDQYADVAAAMPVVDLADPRRRTDRPDGNHLVAGLHIVT